MLGYGQFCTVARGAEVFGERWTPLVVRELLCGSTPFNDIRRGVPRMSATLLAQRLRKLEEIGVIERVKAKAGRRVPSDRRGRRTAAPRHGARALGRTVDRQSTKREQLDAGFLMWDIRRFAHRELFPAQQRVVIQFRFTDARRGEREWWLVVENGEVDLCRDDPGHEVTLIVESTVRALTEIWSGDLLPGQALDQLQLRVLGRPRDARDFWRWIGTSGFAPPRLAAHTQ